jgi:hypothetical protein
MAGRRGLESCDIPVEHIHQGANMWKSIKELIKALAASGPGGLITLTAICAMGLAAFAMWIVLLVIQVFQHH